LATARALAVMLATTPLPKSCVVFNVERGAQIRVVYGAAKPDGHEERHEDWFNTKPTAHVKVGIMLVGVTTPPSLQKAGKVGGDGHTEDWVALALMHR
jgi:hypothetical protein